MVLATGGAAEGCVGHLRCAMDLVATGEVGDLCGARSEGQGIELRQKWRFSLIGPHTPAHQRHGLLPPCGGCFYRPHCLHLHGPLK